MKFFILLISLISSGVLLAGPFVSGGIIKELVYVSCEGKMKNEQVYFDIRSAKSRYKEGALYSKNIHIGDKYTSFVCKDFSQESMDELVTWKCTENDDNKNEKQLLKIILYRLVEGSSLVANITTGEFYPLNPKINSSLKCHDLDI